MTTGRINQIAVRVFENRQSRLLARFAPCQRGWTFEANAHRKSGRARPLHGGVSHIKTPLATVGFQREVGSSRCANARQSRTSCPESPTVPHSVVARMQSSKAFAIRGQSVTSATKSGCGDGKVARVFNFRRNGDSRIETQRFERTFKINLTQLFLFLG